MKEYLTNKHIKSLTNKHIKLLMRCDIGLRGFKNLAECIPDMDSLMSLDISITAIRGCLVKLLKASKDHGILQTQHINVISIGRSDVPALGDLIDYITPTY